MARDHTGLTGECCQMQTEALTSAEEFIAFLRPSRPQWWDAENARRTHYFRGHADHSWPLLPHGLRPLGATNPLTPILLRFEQEAEAVNLAQTLGLDEPSKLRYILWKAALAEASFQFAGMGRQIGLETLWNVQASRMRGPFRYVHSSEIDLGLRALAQHHKIPTDLLDWSEDPLTAAFFATGGEAADTDLCVWALRAEPAEYEFDNTGARIVLSLATTSGNPNIRAQNGIFMHYWGAGTVTFTYDYEGQRWRAFEEHAVIDENLIKVTLPATEREKLRRLLLAERRSAAHLMPSWSNAAAAVLERWSKDSF
jgi:hypothetical protein